MLEKPACFDPNADTFAPDESDGKGSRAADSGVNEGDERRTGREVVSLIVELERMARREIPPDQRISLLKILEPQVIEISDRMPKPVAAARHSEGRGPRGQTLEQRLYCLTAKNLRLSLETFDRSPLAYTEGAVAQRSWLVRHLFRLFSREIEYSVRWDRPWPPFMWQELHDLYFYLSQRKDIDLGNGEAGTVLPFDYEQEYKRLLLLGLVKLLVHPSDRSSMLYRGLPAWARASALKDPDPFSGTFDMYVVEICSDGPPRQRSSALDPGFRGWILEPAQGFLDYVTGFSVPA